MKAVVIIAALLLPTAAHAQQDICAEIGEMAENIMLARQHGIVMSEMIGRANATDAPQPIKDLAIGLIKGAYDTPQFSVDENRTDAAIQFRNESELACYQAK